MIELKEQVLKNENSTTHTPHTTPPVISMIQVSQK